MRKACFVILVLIGMSGLIALWETFVVDVLAIRKWDEEAKSQCRYDQCYRYYIGGRACGNHADLCGE